MAAQIILIGGTSHAGKSTLAAEIARRLRWRCVSTDSLARHPGRPWRDAPDVVPPHVVEHYRDLSLDELMQSVLRHYDSMWGAHILPLINAQGCFVMEGSALLPDKIASVMSNEVKAVWLVGSDGFIDRRIKAESDYENRDASDRALIDKFTLRAQAFNRFIADEVTRLELPKIDIEAEDLSARLFAALHISI